MKKPYKGICALCQKEKNCVHINRQTKQPICPRCYRTHFHKRFCAICHKVKSAAKRLPGNKYLCTACLNKLNPAKNRIGLCAICRREKPVAISKKDGLARCYTCAQKIRPKEICSGCGHSRIIVKRTKDGHGLCSGCYQKTLIGLCLGCGWQRIIHAKKRCNTCYRRLSKQQKTK